MLPASKSNQRSLHTRSRVRACLSNGVLHYDDDDNGGVHIIHVSVGRRRRRRRCRALYVVCRVPSLRVCTPCFSK